MKMGLQFCGYSDCANFNPKHKENFSKCDCYLRLNAKFSGVTDGIFIIADLV